MLKSIINGATTTPAQLAKEIVFYHGEYAVIALPSILGAAGMKATDREFGLVSEQVVKILARVPAQERQRACGNWREEIHQITDRRDVPGEAIS